MVTAHARGLLAGVTLLAAVALGIALNPPAASAATYGVAVVGSQLSKDGAAFLPRGFNMIAVLAPDGCTTVPREATAARASFGAVELAAARNEWHANLVRFQVSQRGLDPQDAIYTPAYLDRIRNAVTLAQSQRLVVILSMQDQSYSCGSAHPLPSAATQRAWTNLAPLFGSDPNVLFELFNEPNNASTSAGWAQWRDGGIGPMDNQGEVAVGHQALVNLVRSLGATNVLIADGANHAGQLQGLPLLTDSLQTPQIAYGVHPYYFHVSGAATLATDQANWDKRFGYLAGTAPLIATEWNSNPNDCTAGTAARIPDFFGYLQAKNIGLLGHAFDAPNTMVKDLVSWQPTTMDGYGCNVTGPGAGQLVQAHFAELAAGDPPPDVTAPTVTLTAPADQAAVRGSVPVTADVADDVGVTAVKLLVDGVDVRLAAPAPFTPAAMTWDSATVADGAHTLQVQAQDAAGNTGVSQPVTVTVVNDDHQPPSAVAGLTAALNGSGGVGVSWQPATDNVAVGGYRLYRNGGLIATLDGATTSYRDDAALGPPPGYQVEALDAAGNVGPLSAVAYPTTADATAPSVPADVTVQAVTSSQVSLSWSASTDNVGVAGYHVYRDGALAGTAQQPSYPDESLSDGRTYTYTVSSYDAAGNESSVSAAVSATTPDVTAPTVPTELAGSVQPSQVSLSWRLATDNVGVAGYHVWRDGALIGTTSGAPWVDMTVAQGQTYSYVVSAFDAAGNNGAASNTAIVTVPDTLAPTAPGKPAAVLQGGAVKLSWLAATDNVGVTSYTVKRGGTALGTVTGLAYTDPVAKQGQTYTYTVTASDAAGNVGSASSPTSIKVPDTVAPSTPTNLKGTPGTRSVTLSWTASTDNVAVTGYEIFRGGNKIATVTGRTYTNSGLASGSNYTYKVRAYDAAGNFSAFTGTVTVKAR